MQIGSLNESHALPAASYQTSAFDGRSDPGGLRRLHLWRSAPARCCGLTQSQGPDRAGTTEWLFLFDRHFGGLNYRKDDVSLFEIHSLH